MNDKIIIFYYIYNILIYIHAEKFSNRDDFFNDFAGHSICIVLK